MKRILMYLGLFTIGLQLYSQNPDIDSTGYFDDAQYNVDVSKDTIDISPCDFINIIDTPVKAHILEKFIHKSITESGFINNKGIVHLHVYRHPGGAVEWNLFPVIDDRYKDNPAPKFTVFNGDIILIYEANQDGVAKEIPNPEPLAKCLDKVVGDRVYIRPKRQWRWNNVVFNGRRLEGSHREATGKGLQIKVTFYENGSYEVDPYFSF